MHTFIPFILTELKTTMISCGRKQIFSVFAVAVLIICSTTAFVHNTATITKVSKACLNMGIFDGWNAGGSNKEKLDEEWEKQQEMLKLRRAPQGARDKYFNNVSTL